ncbi:hypothetical protein EXS71_01910 [Candidatus Uhrbacteria bacterium]|nr:hypothetical protein [Candidatus Uhrbacteria bacterium]
MSTHEPTNGEILEVLNKHGKILENLHSQVSDLQAHTYRTDVKFDILNRTIDEKVEDVLVAMNRFSTDTEKQFNQIDQRFNRLKNKIRNTESTKVSPLGRR